MTGSPSAQSDSYSQSVTRTFGDPHHSAQVANYRQYADLLGLGYDVTGNGQGSIPAYAGSLGLQYSSALP